MALDKHTLGKRLAKLRRTAGHSQAQWAHFLGVTDKAVSKWETGASYPRMELLIKISELCHIPLKDLFDDRGSSACHPIMIAITGGPGAGKTAALARIERVLTERGWRVLVIPEVATGLIEGGVNRYTCASDAAFEEQIFKLQLAQENAYRAAAEGMDVPKIIILCDRGLVDCAVYLSTVEFERVLHELHLTLEQVYQRYDAVFHLQTAAKGAPDSYSCASNEARVETPPEAIRADDILLAAWSGHERRILIKSMPSFAEKMDTLTEAVLAFLEEPALFAHHRSYLIRKPDITVFATQPACTRLDCVRTYLFTGDTTRSYLQKTTASNITSYSKVFIQSQQIEGHQLQPLLEERINYETYRFLKGYADTSFAPVTWTSFCLCETNRMVTLHLFPFFPYQALVSIESDSSEYLALPPDLCLIREITNNKTYTFQAFARALAQKRL